MLMRMPLRTADTSAGALETIFYAISSSFPLVCCFHTVSMQGDLVALLSCFGQVEKIKMFSGQVCDEFDDSNVSRFFPARVWWCSMRVFVPHRFFVLLQTKVQDLALTVAAQPRRGKGMANPFSRYKLRQVPQRE